MRSGNVVRGAEAGAGSTGQTPLHDKMDLADVVPGHWLLKGHSGVLDSCWYPSFFLEISSPVSRTHGSKPAPTPLQGPESTSPAEGAIF